MRPTYNDRPRISLPRLGPDRHPAGRFRGWFGQRPAGASDLHNRLWYPPVPPALTIWRWGRLRIPREVGQGYRFYVGHRSDLKPAIIPISFRPPAGAFQRFRLGQQRGHFFPRKPLRGGLDACKERADDAADTTIRYGWPKRASARDRLGVCSVSRAARSRIIEAGAGGWAGLAVAGRADRRRVGRPVVPPQWRASLERTGLRTGTGTTTGPPQIVCFADATVRISLWQIVGKDRLEPNQDLPW
jgi:hypothetical protein